MPGAKPVHRAPGGGSVFVVDDEESVRFFLGKMLETSGLKPSLYSDAGSFKTAIAERRPDFVMLDLALQADDGINVLRELANVKYQGRVVLMSGIDERVLDAAVRYGVDCGLNIAGRLQKPFDMPRLRSFLLTNELLPLTVSDDDIRKALAAGQLFHVYQPKLDLRSNRVVGAEALIRWKHPMAGDMSPGRFLPQLSPTGLHDMTHGLFAGLFEQARNWEQQGIGCDLAINVPVRLICAPEFYDWVKELRASTGVRAPLTLEVTEEDACVNELEASVNIARFRLLGLSIALDDFGKGHSSLARLRNLPISELKIDQTFVKGLSHDEINQVIVKSVLMLAQGLRMKATAEGVEDEPALAYLRELGFDYAQGYHIARPMLPEAFEALMRRQAQS